MKFSFDREDETYRTCSVCGSDCIPEHCDTEGKGVRFAWICPEHGIHTITDPFAHLRDQERKEHSDKTTYYT